MKVVTFGRSHRNQVVLNNPTVSRVHCQIIQHDNGSFTILDCNSGNGTFVNGRCIYGESSLSYGDSVRLGNENLSWQSYFGTAHIPYVAPPARRLSGGAIAAIVLGAAALVALIVVILVLGSNKDKTPQHQAMPESAQQQIATSQPPATETQQSETIVHKNRQFNIGGVGFDFNMSINDIRNENPNVVFSSRRQSPGIPEGTDVLQGFYYYLVNNNIVLYPDDNGLLSYMSTGSVDFVTPRNCRVGSTWGSVMRNYPNAYCSEEYLYDCISSKFDLFIILYDQASGTSFAFDESQFTVSQLNELHAHMNPSDYDTDIDLDAVNPEILNRISSSVKVYQITVGRNY